MKRLAILLISMLSAGTTLAQQGTSPFDMGVERRDQGLQDAPATPQPATPPAATPTPGRSNTPNATPLPGASSRPGVSAPAAAQPMPSPVVQPANGAEIARRYLLPFSSMRLNGEIEQRSWSIYLTADQAGRPARIHVAYQNSIFVAPETSKLTITINDVAVVAEPIASAEKQAERVFDIPAGLLRAGANDIRFAASQRHRTDCTVESTYELWTQVDPAKTFVTFEGGDNRRLSRLDDLRAIGVDGKGNTRFRIIAPALDQIGAANTLMRLSQGLALMGGMPNQSFTLRRQAGEALAPGEIPVFIGTADELRSTLPDLTPAASNAAVASFSEFPGSNGASALVLAGPSWPAIEGLVESFVGSVDGSATQRRETLSTESWRGMDTPLLFSGATLDFSTLGIPSQEFSGRLFRTSFAVGVPADFYANAYGEARILLDAAYVPEVLPGSHIDVIVNGNIATTVPITSTGGAVLRHLPIKLTLRHFRPGVNVITIEAALRTASDASCSPGAAADDKPRFALFGTSQLQMPDFARIAQVPNVAATAGIGFPYFLGQDPVSLFLGRIDEPTLSAAATLAGKIASASHRVTPLNVTISAARMAGRDAIFVGGIAEIPANVLGQLKIDQNSRSSWSPDLPGQAAPAPDLNLQDWQERADANFISRQVTKVSLWAKENFDLSLSALRFAPATDELYTPPRSAHFLMAQESDPTGLGTWTAALAPDSRELAESMQEISAQEAWEKLGGRISIYSGPEKEIVTVPVSWFRFLPTQELSLANARLIAANWLSDNIMSYALLLAAGSVLLGLATGGLLSLLGRR